MGERGLRSALDPVEPAQDVAGLDVRLQERLFGADPVQIDHRAHARGAHTDDRRDQAEHGFVEEHGRAPDHDRDGGERGARREPPVGDGLRRRRAHRLERSATRSASSPTIWVRRKSLGV